MTNPQADLPEGKDEPEVADARVVARRKWSPSWVWLVPFVAIIIGLWLAVSAVMSKGPTITIAFNSGEGLEAGKTKIKYKDVGIGEVTAVRLGKDRKEILVTAELTKEAEDYLAADSRFWVVRPRIAGGSVSGLGTLLSGAYIAMDVGKTQTKSKLFKGLDVAPVVTGDLPGRSFLLHADNLGSLDIGSPVYFRRVPVGQVVAYRVDTSGKGVTLTVFINEPYDKFVNRASRFWHASGLDLSLDANGFKVSTESLAALALGGVAFESPMGTDNVDESPATANSNFTLADSRVQALQHPDTDVAKTRFKFRQSLRGLTIGAPIDFRGITIGDVASIGVEFDDVNKDFLMIVDANIYPSRLDGLMRNQKGKHQKLDRLVSVQTLVKNGFRAQLRPGNILTGQAYIALDFFPKAPPATVTFEEGVGVLPTIPGELEELQRVLQSILRKLDKMPLDEIGDGLNSSVKSLNQTLQTTNKVMGKIDGQMLPETLKTLEKLQKTLDTAGQTLQPDSPLQKDVRSAAQQVTEAVKSFRELTDYLGQHPEALIRGKQGDKP